ncbi:hypothetical protein PIB30_051049 [Stylosanthes scabra]|uniref:Uncharacterized protein n=1 Tax=Stylosanthes scabra TaxID=79078 RepID=A0ABU6QH54_9FABA|nr:hypothetical protein [Stylosanthes scabra]
MFWSLVIDAHKLGYLWDTGKRCLDARWRDQGSRVCIELGVQNREPRSRGACKANDSAYGNSGPSGVVSAVGSLFPRGTKANVAPYGSGRGAFCYRPGYQPRVWHFIRTENPWVGDSHSVYYQTFQVQVQAWKVGEASVELRVSSSLRRSSLPLRALEN